MLPSAISFDVVYSHETAAHVAQKFRDYRFKRYGALMIIACVINALGLLAALWLGARPDAASMLFLYFVVGIGPVWLLYEHFVWPSRYVSRLLRLLPSPGRVSLSSESVSVQTRKQDAVIQWSKIRTVLETPQAFLLVLYPFAFLFIPKANLPTEAYDAFRSKVA